MRLLSLSELVMAAGMCMLMPVGYVCWLSPCYDNNHYYDDRCHYSFFFFLCLYYWVYASQIYVP